MSLVQDGRVCRVSYTVNQDKINLTKNEQKGFVFALKYFLINLLASSGGKSHGLKTDGLLVQRLSCVCA